MGLLDALRDRGQARQILDPNDHRLHTGSPEERDEARREWYRNSYAARVMNAGWREIPRGQLEFQKFGVIEDTETGDFLRVFGGDPDYAESVVAFYVTHDGTPVMLAPVVGVPHNRAELEQIRAEREARRNTPKPKPAWMR
jgi:hypothetical protein